MLRITVNGRKTVVKPAAGRGWNVFATPILNMNHEDYKS